jgi:hypothetical protein
VVNCGLWETVSNGSAGSAGEGVGTACALGRVVSIISLPSLIPNCRAQCLVMSGHGRDVDWLRFCVVPHTPGSSIRQVERWARD